jgi:hypothetical protein
LQVAEVIPRRSQVKVSHLVTEFLQIASSRRGREQEEHEDGDSQSRPHLRGSSVIGIPEAGRKRSGLNGSLVS